jgi:transposase
MNPYEDAILWLHNHSGEGVHAHSVTQMNRPECLRAWSRIIWKNRLYRKYPNALAM